MSKLVVEEFEVEEKPKSYVCKRYRFLKENIGVLSGYNFRECLLLENNPAVAADLFIKRLEEINGKLNKQISDNEKGIEYLKAIKNMEA
jgi:predicted RecB family nuclease